MYVSAADYHTLIALLLARHYLLPGVSTKTSSNQLAAALPSSCVLNRLLHTAALRQSSADDVQTKTHAAERKTVTNWVKTAMQHQVHALM